MDIQPLLCHFLGANAPEISREALTLLETYDWPGNVRQLQNIATRIQVQPGDQLISSKWLRNQLGIQQPVAHENDLSKQILHLFRQESFSNDAPRRIAANLGNMHRSTITEYLKGFTFQFLVQSGYDIQGVQRLFNPSGDLKADQRLKNRVLRYLRNLVEILDVKKGQEDNMQNVQQFMAKVPKRFHESIRIAAQAYLQGLWRL